MKYLESLLLAMFAVFAPLKAVLLTTTVLVFADLISGLLAARKKKIPITSTGLKRTVGKIVLYEIALCLAFLAEHYLIGPMFPISKMVSAMIGLVEMKSILENMDIIAGQSVFQSVLTKITQSQGNK